MRRFVPAWSVLAAALVLAGCAAPADPVPPGPPRHLAATPEPLEPEERAPPNTTATPSTGASGSSASSSLSATPSFRARARFVDPAGDAGLQAPDYADLISIVVESDGKEVRVTVDVGAELPSPLPGGEVMGIGVDFYRDDKARESDYQLFADGGDDGWFAYLQTPGGFVEYPGAFRLGAGRLVFQVPTQSLGGLTATEASSFLDWSRAGTLVNAAAADRAPDSGRAPIAP